MELADCRADQGATGKALEKIDYSATKLGGSLIWHVSKSVALVGGYYAGVSGRNIARERTASSALWINHDPRTGAPPRTPH